MDRQEKLEQKQVLAKIRINFPENLWISEIFKRFPNITMEITSFLPYILESSIGNIIAEIYHHDIDRVIETIKNHESVFEFNIFERNDNIIKFTIKIKDAYILDALIQNGVLVNFPVSVSEGQAYWRFIADRNALDNFLVFLEERKIKFTILKIGNSPYAVEEMESNLSIDECSVLAMAIKLGFFEVPRRISLEDLSKKMGRSKATMSVLLRKIIKKKVVI